jgi:putative membrane protein
MHQSHLVVGIVHLLLTAVSVVIVASVLPGIKVKSYGSALAFAVVVGLLNAAAWWFFRSTPDMSGMVRGGIGGLIVNGIIFLVASRIVGGVKISGCITAVIAMLGVTFVNWLMHGFFGKWAP